MSTVYNDNSEMEDVRHGTRSYPILEEAVAVCQRPIRTDFDLPVKDEYGEFIRSFIA